MRRPASNVEGGDIPQREDAADPPNAAAETQERDVAAADMVAECLAVHPEDDRSVGEIDGRPAGKAFEDGNEQGRVDPCEFGVGRNRFADCSMHRDGPGNHRRDLRLLVGRFGAKTSHAAARKEAPACSAPRPRNTWASTTVAPGLPSSAERRTLVIAASRSSPLRPARRQVRAAATAAAASSRGEGRVGEPGATTRDKVGTWPVPRSPGGNVRHQAVTATAVTGAGMQRVGWVEWCPE
jgi:hypothetical protein